MTRNISLLAVTALLALLACVAPRASAQTFDKTHSTALILAGGGNDLLNSLTIQLTGNAGNGLTWNLNPVNANGVFVNDGTGAISFSTTLPGSLTLNNETIGGTTSIGGSTSINTSGAITTTSTISGGAVTFSSETVNGNTTLDALPNTGGAINIGNSTPTLGDTSTTTINGVLNVTGPTNFSGPVNIPAGGLNLGLANDKFYIGSALGTATPQTISQDVTITNTGVATVNGATGNFKVTGNDTINGNLDVKGNFNIGGAASVDTLNGNVDFTGPTINFKYAPTFPAGSFADSSITLTNDNVLIGNSSNQSVAHTISQDVTITNTGVATVNGATGNFKVTGNDTINGNLDVKGNFNIGGAASVDTLNGNVDFTGPTINFKYAPTFPAGSFADSSITLTNDNVLIGNSSNQSVAHTISQDVTITNTGAATVNSASGTKFTVSGYEDVTGGQNVTGPDTLSTLSTSGLATLNKATVTNNLLVSGGAKVVGNDTTGGNAFITGYQTITGGQQIGGNDTVIGTLYSNGNANIDASPSTSGAVNIGNSTSTTTFNGTLNLSGTTITLPNNSVTNAQLQNSTIAVGSTGSTLSVTGSPISLGGTAGNVEINLAHANTWSGTQTFGATALTASSPAAFGSNPTADYAIGTSNTYFKISTSIAAGDTLSGIANGADGRVIILLNNGSANSIILVNEDGNDATPANRIHLAGGGTSAGAGTGGGPTLILAPDGFVTLIYDATISRWRVLSSK